MPHSGTIIPPTIPSASVSPATLKPAPVLVLSASYTDVGGNNIKALTGNSSIVIRSNMVTFAAAKKVKGFTPYKSVGTKILLFPSNEG